MADKNHSSGSEDISSDIYQQLQKLFEEGTQLSGAEQTEWIDGLKVL